MSSTRARTALAASVVAAAVVLAAAAASSAPWLTSALGFAGLLVLAGGLARSGSMSVAVAAGLLGCSVATAQPADSPFAPLETAALVAVLLLGWWSVDDRWPVAVATGSERARLVTTVAIVVGAGAIGLVLVAARRVATGGVIGPVAGAAAAVSLALAAWAAIQLDRHRAGDDGPGLQ